MPWADLLSLSRIPLGIAFLWLVMEPWLGLALMATAALTDVLDGWVARRSATTTQGRHRGDWLDPVCDKIFVLFVVISLAWTFQSPVMLVGTILLREILQVASLLIYAAIPWLRRRGPYNYRANRLGKITTILQFTCAVVVLFGNPTPWPLAITTGVMGCASLATYIARVGR